MKGIFLKSPSLLGQLPLAVYPASMQISGSAMGSRRNHENYMLCVRRKRSYESAVDLSASLLAGGLGSFSLSNIVIAHLQEEEKVRCECTSIDCQDILIIGKLIISCGIA